jgi:hypothetical protein
MFFLVSMAQASTINPDTCTLVRSGTEWGSGWTVSGDGMVSGPPDTDAEFYIKSIYGPQYWEVGVDADTIY